MPNPKVVILCMENHSFDEYFGTFPGAVGFYDPNGTEQFTQAGFSEAPVLQPFRTSTFSTSAEWHASYAHWWPEQHEAWNYGALSGWSVQDGASVKLPSGETVEEGAGVMGYFAANDIPYHWNLAENFLLCDSYFCSVLGPTFANRIALMSGTIFDPEVPLPTGTPVIPWGINPPPPAVADGENVPTIDNTSAPNLTWLSYPGILAEKNESCTWTIYDDQNWGPEWLQWKNWNLPGQPDPPPPDAGEANLPAYLAYTNGPNGPTPGWPNSYHLNVLDQLADPQPPDPNAKGTTGSALPYYSATAAGATFSNFETDAQSGHLPDVSWIVPPCYLTEHPPNMPADGECYLARVVNAVVNSPQWAVDAENDGIVLIITYDENDGHFDHVVPPTSLQEQLYVNSGSGELKPLPAPVQNAVTQNPNAWTNVPKMPPAGDSWEPWVSGNSEGGPLLTGPAGAGFRVPTIIVSPWTYGGSENLSSVKAPDKFFDHSSIIQYLEDVTTTTCTNLPPKSDPAGWRRSMFSSLGDLIDTSLTPSASEEVANAMSQAFESVDAWRLDALTRLFGSTPVPPLTTGPTALLPPTSPTPAQVFPPIPQQCYLIMGKTTFGKDEVSGQSELQNGSGIYDGMTTFGGAFWVVVDGFDPAEVGLAYVPSVPGSLAPQVSANVSIAGQSSSLVTATVHATPVADNSSLPDIPQRFRFTCDINFLQGASTFDTLGIDAANPIVELQVAGTFSSRLTWTSPIEMIELVDEPDPFIQNGSTLVLSDDVRAFTVKADGQDTIPGCPHTLDAGSPDPLQFIQNVISWFHDHPLDWPLPPNPDDDTAEESVSTVTIFPTDNGTSTVPTALNPAVLNFALARVTLQGVSLEASNVRVFFRLFPAQSTGTVYDQATLYRATPLNEPNAPNPSDAQADPQQSNPQTNPNAPNPNDWMTRVPLLGIGETQPITGSDIASIPFFATARVNATGAGAVSMTTQDPDWPNTQTISPNSDGSPNFGFFGCWLDMNQVPSAQPADSIQGPIVGNLVRLLPKSLPQDPGHEDGPYVSGPYQPISAFAMSQHQCLVAEVAYDPIPIPAGTVPGDSDKLCQRNLTVVGGVNA